MTHPKDLTKHLSKQRLAEILADTATYDDALQQRLKLELLGDQPTAIAAEIKARINRATRPRHFVGYREASAFSDKLFEIASAIQERLLPLDPDLTLALCSYFLDTDARVYENVDDSGGDIGGAYRHAAEIFSQAAKVAKDRERLVAATLKCIRGNEYGSHDPIHSACGKFLSDEEFGELLESLREDFKNSPKSDFHGSEKFRYAHAAESKGDPDLFLQVIREIRQSPLEAHDRLRLAKLLSARQRHEEALEQIEGLPATGAWERDLQSIRIAALQSLGRHDEIIALYKRNFRSQPSPETFDAWLASVSEDQRPQARKDAIDIARDQISHPESSIRLFLHLGEIEHAANFVERAIDTLSGASWYSLPEYAQAFEKAQRPTAALLLYRKLLEDILDNARLKAYRHAAKYWRKLDQLATLAEPPPPHPSSQDYKQRLTEAHQRKSSFWRELG